MLEIVTPADDLNLLTIEELRVAAGLASDDDSEDASLDALGLRVASMIAAACQVSRGGAVPATLLLEGLLETFRLIRPSEKLFLSRRPVAGITSVIEGATSLTQDVDYEVDAANAVLIRLSNDYPSWWACGKIVVEYDAGFEQVPEDLKAIAQQLAGAYWADTGLDPMEKSIGIPGLISLDRWVDSSANPQMPADIMQALIDGGYVNRQMVL